MNAFIRFLYSLLIAVAVSVFVGITIFSFYQPPKSPQFPDFPPSANLDPNSSQFQEQQKQFDQKNRDYQQKSKEHQGKFKKYNKNVSMIVLPLALGSLAVGLWAFKRSEVIGEGLALGGVTTSLYGVITASIADARILRFLAVTILLGSLLLVAKQKFNTQETKKSKA